MLRMNERPIGDVMILDLRGTVTPGSAEVGLGDKVRSILHCGYRKVLLNLAAMTSSDASGISALLSALHLTRDAGAELKLLHVTRRLRDVLIIVALHGYFTTFDSEAEALESFRFVPPVPVAPDRAPRDSRREATQAA